MIQTDGVRKSKLREKFLKLFRGLDSLFLYLVDMEEKGYTWIWESDIFYTTEVTNV